MSVSKTSPKLVVLGTGGTIAGTATDAADNIGYTAAQVGVGQLLQAIPALQGALRGHTLVSEQVAQVDSKDMDFSVWQALAAHVAYWLAQADVSGIVITHGTDTLEETAYFLQAMLAPDKPVVLTCAMRPANSAAPDGPQNVLDAVAVALAPGVRGVTAVCAGTIHGAQDVQKVHTYRLDAFSSGDAGPVGYVEEGAVRQLRAWPQTAPRQTNFPASWPRVEIAMNYAGAGRSVVDALLNDGSQPPLRGIVVAGTGNGTLNHALEGALLDAQSRGVRVVRASRCAQGRVLSAPASALVDSQGLSPVKARIVLMLDLMAQEG